MIEHLQSVLNRYCLTITDSPWDAEDLAQETWLKLISSTSSLRHKNPEALLIRIAKNTRIDYIRREAILSRIKKQQQAEVTLTEEDGNLLIEAAFQSLMKHLSPLQRTVFLLRDVFHYSIAETADKLGTSVGAVKATLHRARQSLSAVREDLGEGEHEQPLPENEDLKAVLRVMTAAYQCGDITILLELVRLDLVEPAMAIGITQSRALLQRIKSISRVGTVSSSQNVVWMAA
jgi:RNA polymerase sigma factor (sigma-70 family)